MNLFIYVIDGSQGFLDNPADWLDSLFTIGDITVVSVADMVDKVNRRLAGRKMRNLFIGGHGSPGYQAVGDQGAWDTTGERSLQLGSDGELLGGAKASIPLLASKFISGAICTLGGCQTGRGSAGEALLQKLSAALGVISVQAGTDNQRPFVPGMEGSVVRYTGSRRDVLSGGWLGSPGGYGIN
jgi:hypothetical protein